jgi:hypothetical protein
MDGAGDEFAGWACNDPTGVNPSSVQEATLPFGGSWSPAVTVGATNSPGGMAIAIDGHGYGLLVWQAESADNTYTQIDAAVIAPDGSVSSQTTLSQPGFSSIYPSVAMNAAGDAVVGWFGWNGPDSTATLEAPFATIGTVVGGFQGPQILDVYGGRLDATVALAMDPNGDAAAAWEREGPLNSAISIAGGAFSASTAVPSDGAPTADPMITMDADGNVTVVWEEVAPGDWRIDDAREPLTGGFGPLQQVSDTLSYILGNPVLASDPTGDTVVAWEGEVGGGDDVLVQKAVFQAGGAFQPPFQVADAGTAGFPVSVSMAGSGTPTVAWSHVDASGNITSYVSTGDPVVTQLPQGAVAPVLASDSAGDLGAVWAGSTQSGTAIFASRASATPPDTVPPSLSVSHTADGSNGWNRSSPVSESVLASDSGDGLAGTPSCTVDGTPVTLAGGGGSWTFSVSTEGIHAVACSVSDKAGNQASASDAVKIDTRAPVVTYSGNTGSYTVADTVSITCQAADPTPGSGLATSTCHSISGPAYNFALGTNSYSAQATDIAGNTGSGRTSFTVTVSPASLCLLTTQFIESSTKYKALSSKQQAIVLQLATGACKTVAAITPKLNSTQKQLLIAGYKAAIGALVPLGWLTGSQATILSTLAGSL